MRYINLNTHSSYSLLSSSISIDDIIKFSISNCLDVACLVDIDNMYGAMEFYIKCKKNNIKSVIGIQIQDNTRPTVILAKNYAGYISLCKISSSILTKDSDFNLLNFDLENLIIISDCNNTLPKSVCFYHTNDVACHESFFTNKEDYDVYKAIVAIKTNGSFNEIILDDKMRSNYLLTEAEGSNRYSADQIKKLSEIIAMINIEIPLFKNNHFVKFDKKYDSFALLSDRCRNGLIQRFKSDVVEKKYIDRLMYELDVINDMGFCDYFLVVQDYVLFAKQNDILVGAGRGSAAGSLVSYVLHITDLDPIENNLIFERFLNSERKSMPDIDIDFMDHRRPEIFDYIFNKYNKNNVAHIITFQKIKAKMAIRDVGRILGIELPIINFISKSIPFDLDFDLKHAIKSNKKIISLYNQYNQLFDIACKLIDLPRQIGTHAAGIIIANQELTNIIPICHSADGIITTQFSMQYLEMNGLIKMDILGLVNLSIIYDCIKMIYKAKNIKISLDNICLNDQKVFSLLTQAKTLGIFQLESSGMQNLITKIKPVSIEDISVTSALFRPGPQENIPQYLKNKSNPASIKYLNDDIRKILEPTYGIIIYQEQVIEMVRKIANYSLSQADLFRRSISKKDFNQLDSLKYDFIESSVKNGYRTDDSERVFNYILKFANYGFNHSHSLAYSKISYQMAYLKTHFPLEFYTCLLSYSDNSVEKMFGYITEIKQSGINVLSPDITFSKSEFIIKDNSIVFGFKMIKGIGSETIKKILLARKQKPFNELFSTISSLVNGGVGEKSILLLIKSGCFDSLINKYGKTRTFIIHNFNKIFQDAKTRSEKYGAIVNNAFEEVDVTEEVIQNETLMQYECIGINFSMHNIAKIKNKYQLDGKYTSINQLKLSNRLNLNFECLCQVLSIKKITTKTNVPMAFVKLEDETGMCEAVCFNEILSNEVAAGLLVKGKILILKINKNSKSFLISSVVKELKNE